MGGNRNVGNFGFYAGSNLMYYGIQEFSAFGGTVYSVKYGFSRLNCCMFCEVQLSLVFVVYCRKVLYLV